MIGDIGVWSFDSQKILVTGDGGMLTAADPELVARAGHESSYYMYWVQLPQEIRDAVPRDLYDDGVYTTFRYPALHLVDAFASEARLHRTESAVEKSLCLPLHQGLSDSDVEKVVEALHTAVRRRSVQKTVPFVA